MDVHKKLVQAEKSALEERKVRSTAAPDQILHIMVDCPDKVYLPHFSVPATAHSRMAKVPFQSVGLINVSTDEYFYFDFFPWWAKTPNLIMSVLYMYLFTFLRTVDPSKRPRILWLQMDNCFKENKNRFMIGFLAWMVYIGWFSKVVISFLPPGHSHADVDRMFSSRSNSLKKNDATTPIHLQNLTSKSSKKSPACFFIPCIWNWSGLFAPCMEVYENHITPHVWTFQLYNNKVGMKTKMWHSSMDDFAGLADDPQNPIDVFSLALPLGFP